MHRDGSDRWALDQQLRAAERVLTHAQLRDLGVSPATIMRRIGPDGPWQRLLPGVVLAHRGTPTRRERILGALARAGPDSVVTGSDALRLRGAGQEISRPVVHVLLPDDRRRTSHGFALFERTRRLPDPVTRQGIPCAGVARAVVDQARRTEELDGVRGLIAHVVQRRLCTVDEIRSEVDATARQRTALSRRVLWEVGDGVRSVAEAKARAVMAAHGIPAPAWNIQLIDADGEPFLSPDAWWEDVAAALEIDSVAWHLSPQAYRLTQQRQRWMTTRGVLLLSFPPVEIIESPEQFAHEVRDLLAQASRRPVPTGIRARRAR